MVHLCSLCMQLYTLRGCHETVWPADSSIHSHKSRLCNTAAHKERSTQPSKHLLQEPAATSLSCGLRFLINKYHSDFFLLNPTMSTSKHTYRETFFRLLNCQSFIQSHKYRRVLLRPLRPLPCVHVCRNTVVLHIRDWETLKIWLISACVKDI